MSINTVSNRLFDIRIRCIFSTILQLLLKTWFLFLSSIFVAFILEAFMLEYSFTHGKFAAAFENKIEEKGVGVGSYVYPIP